MENYSITKTELWAYISKTADASTKLKVEQWLHSDNYDEQLFAEIELVYKMTGDNQQLPVSLDVVKDKFFKTVEPIASNSFQWKNVLKYAAILVFVLATSIVTYQKFSVDDKQTLVQTTYGEHKEIELPDGSLVWLNASSKLSYFEASPREIYLEGEAYFEVAKDKKHPFIVSTKDKLNVKALGTSFNVKAYTKTDLTETILFTGKVEVSSDKYFKDRILMLPKDKVTFSKKNNKVVKSKAEFMTSSIAWKEGRIAFKNKPFKEIANDLSIQYNVKISFKNKKTSNSKFTGSFDKSTSVTEILETLKLSKHFEYEKLEDNKWIIK